MRFQIGVSPWEWETWQRLLAQADPADHWLLLADAVMMLSHPQGCQLLQQACAQGVSIAVRAQCLDQYPKVDGPQNWPFEVSLLSDSQWVLWTLAEGPVESLWS